MYVNELYLDPNDFAEELFEFQSVISAQKIFKNPIGQLKFM